MKSLLYKIFYVLSLVFLFVLLCYVEYLLAKATRFSTLLIAPVRQAALFAPSSPEFSTCFTISFLIPVTRPSTDEIADPIVLSANCTMPFNRPSAVDIPALIDSVIGAIKSSIIMRFWTASEN